MGAIAFIVTLLSIYASSIKRYRTGWVFTMAGCGLWLCIAVTSQQFWLGLQQVVIAALSISALIRLQPRKERPSTSAST